MNIFTKLFSPWDYNVMNKMIELDSQNKKQYLDYRNQLFETVKVIENNEPILSLRQYLDKNIHIDLDDLKIEGVNNEDRLYLRKTVIKKLNQAQKLLPKGYHLTIRDAFRSEALVWKMYHLYVKNLKEKNPELSDKELDLAIRSKLAMPDNKMAPGHMTGGAVDVILCDDDGQHILMRIEGTDVINDPKHQYTFNKNLSKEMYDNRMILYRTMTKVGFANFFGEHWHYSYGDGNWAIRRKKKIAIYGIPKILNK